MPSMYYLFLNLAMGCFALSILCIRGRRLRMRCEQGIDLGLKSTISDQSFEINKYRVSQNSAPGSGDESCCVCTPESPYRFMNMWEIISETSPQCHQG